MELDIPKRLAIWRKRSGLTLQAVADAASKSIPTSKQTLSLIELGEQTDLSVCRLAAVAKALGTDIITFLGPLPKRDAA
jgi:transcriptional regulator with XRE-family HTH domain